MGQRLNIEITDGDNVLANAYYHWSGYTSSALDLTGKILKHLDDVKDIKDNILKACRLLSYTDANFTDEELKFIEKHFNDTDDYIALYVSNKAVNRIDGLIAISEYGINETRQLEEARVTIDLANEKIDFDAIYRETKFGFIDYNGVEEYNELIETDIDFSNISFDKFDDFEESLTDYLKNECAVIYQDEVIAFIE